MEVIDKIQEAVTILSALGGIVSVASALWSRLFGDNRILTDLQIYAALKDDAVSDEEKEVIRNLRSGIYKKLASSKRHDAIGVTLIVISFAVGFALMGSSAGGLVLLGGVWNWALVASMVEGAVLVVFAAATTVVVVAAAKRGKREKKVG